jgi:hypothetical protein
VARAKFGDRLAGKLSAARAGEMLRKFLCHNLCRRIQSGYESSIRATFRQLDRMKAQMDNRLLELRQNTYAAGLHYDATMQVSSDALIYGEKADMKKAGVRYNQAAAEYGVVLTKLLDYLSTLPQSQEVEEEAGRTRKVLALLDHEIELFQARFAARAKMA